ncbi:hypothetical protein J4G52_37555 [Burkholderia cenocepacia]|uniref:hypothetical protein n=1 Tax=Burkholderia cenocepacia TaxID=95486 RepID=UPI001AA0BC37|nr:hypothetical protein [Burkholderia cenocepacia]MBO1859265.1 hypothetical protein [Burkholderia cenocepacia]
MKSIANIVGAGILGLVVAGVIALAMQSLGTFAQFMPPVPWGVGVALLVAACVIGYARGRFFGLVFVAIWALGIGAAMLIGQGTDSVSPMIEAIYRIIPWAFVGCCAFACILNAVM